MNPKFIVIDGIDGSGKTTLCAALMERLINAGHRVALASDPAYYRDRFRCCDDPIERLFLHAASRRRLWHTVIQPALNDGAIVICDRWAKSTLAYQHYGSMLPFSLVEEITNLSIEGMVKPTEILLMIEPTVAMERLRNRVDRAYFDQQDLQFYYRVQWGYIANMDGLGLDSSQPTELLCDQIMKFLEHKNERN